MNTLYDALIAEAKAFNVQNHPCRFCEHDHGGLCIFFSNGSCPIAIVETVQAIALRAGYDLKKV